METLILNDGDFNTRDIFVVLSHVSLQRCGLSKSIRWGEFCLPASSGPPCGVQNSGKNAFYFVPCEGCVATGFHFVSWWFYPLLWTVYFTHHTYDLKNNCSLKAASIDRDYTLLNTLATHARIEGSVQNMYYFLQAKLKCTSWGWLITIGFTRSWLTVSRPSRPSDNHSRVCLCKSMKILSRFLVYYNYTPQTKFASYFSQTDGR